MRKTAKTETTPGTENLKKTGVFRTITLMLTVSVMLIMLAGCGNVKISSTSVGNKTTVKLNGASDGDSAEGTAFSVGKNKKASITSGLEKGELKIDFAEAIDMRTDSDEPENYIAGDVIQSVTIGTDGTIEVTLPEGDYIYQFTAIGDTSGTVTINIE